jgi:hypothetical protein
MQQVEQEQKQEQVLREEQAQQPCFVAAVAVAVLAAPQAVHTSPDPEDQADPEDRQDQADRQDPEDRRQEHP